jgi:hypothetical protein
VEAHTPEQRYADVATWLQLGPLVDVQRNLRALRSQVKAAAEDQSALQRVNSQLAKESANAVMEWEVTKVLEHANTAVIAPLDNTLVLKTLDPSDVAYVVLAERATAEEQKVGLAGLRQMRAAAASLWNESKDQQTQETVVSGTIPVFEAAAAALLMAETAEADERSKAANAAFQAVWNAAEPLFVEGAPSLEACPICATPMSETTAGGVDGIREHLTRHLEELADYAAAKKALLAAETTVTAAKTRLLAALPALLGLLGDEHAALKTEITDYRNAVATWTAGGMPESGPLTATLGRLLAALDMLIADIETKQGDHTYAKAKTKIDRLLELQTECILAERTKSELEKLSEALTAQATAISAEIRKEVQALLDKLQAPMKDIYRRIQGEAAAPIRIELPAEDDSNQQRLHLVVDFAENRTGVQPSGYLSDSQIHSVALALRMAAIIQFNGGAPFLALDDIVSSYDADHRRTIAGLLAELLNERQVIVTTHDERFFNYLKDQLEAKNWNFTRIIGLDPAYGPRFADHKVTDEMIEARWVSGESAANEMRQAEEEWLLGICRDFGVDVRIRPLERAYSYERSELALALASFLKDTKLSPYPIPGVNNRFLTSLQKGEIENFGSHFQDGPYGTGSIGDERTRWDEFKAFRIQFSCPKCKRTRFQRPHGLKKPLCAHKGCETQFEFVAPAPAAPAAGGAA